MIINKMKLKKRKKKVLCICSKGMNRSKYLASYLRRKGYSTKYGGIEPEGEGQFNPLKPKDIDWADIIIIIRKRLKRIFKRKFKNKINNKKLIILDVTDSRRLIPEEFTHLRDLNHKEFQKKWTRPQLRKAIKSYLPLK